MNSKIKILIGVLVVGILLIAGFSIWLFKQPINKSCENLNEEECIKNPKCEPIYIYPIVGGKQYVGCKKKYIEPEVKQVTLTTDKTEYAKGEAIKIILRNNLDKSIWYLNGHKLCSDIDKGYRIYQFLNEKWVDVTPPADCPAVESAGLPIFKELSPNDSVIFTWDSKIFDKVKGSTEAPPGKYKFLMFYKEDEKAEKLKKAYSNEFIISLQKEKNEYHL